MQARFLCFIKLRINYNEFSFRSKKADIEPRLLCRKTVCKNKNKICILQNIVSSPWSTTTRSTIVQFCTHRQQIRIKGRTHHRNSNFFFKLNKIVYGIMVVVLMLLAAGFCLTATAQRDENFKYMRGSLYMMMVEHPTLQYNEQIEAVFKKMDIPEAAWLEAIDAVVPAKFVEMNKKAFALGRES